MNPARTNTHRTGHAGGRDANDDLLQLAEREQEVESMNSAARGEAEAAVRQPPVDSAAMLRQALVQMAREHAQKTVAEAAQIQHDAVTNATHEVDAPTPCAKTENAVHVTIERVMKEPSQGTRVQGRPEDDR